MVAGVRRGRSTVVGKLRGGWLPAILVTALLSAACGGQAQERPSPTPSIGPTVALTGPTSFQVRGQPASGAAPFSAKTGSEVRLNVSGSWPAPIPPAVGSAVSIGYGPALNDAISDLGDDGWQLAAQNVDSPDPMSHWVELRTSKGVAATVTLAAVAPTLALDVQVPSCTSGERPSLGAAEAWLHRSWVGAVLPDPRPVPNPAQMVGHSIPPCARVLGWKTGFITPLSPFGWWWAEVVPARDGVQPVNGLAFGSGRLIPLGFVTPAQWVRVPPSEAEGVLRGLNPSQGSPTSARRALVMQPVFLSEGLVNYVPAWAWVALRHPMQPDQSMTVIATPAFRGAKSLAEQGYD